MKVKRTIEGHEFEIVSLRRGPDVEVVLEPMEESLRPMTMTIHTSWLNDAARLLDAVAKRESFSAGAGAAFAYEGNEVVASFFKASVRVPASLFAAVTHAYKEAAESAD